MHSSEPNTQADGQQVALQEGRSMAALAASKDKGEQGHRHLHPSPSHGGTDSALDKCTFKSHYSH